MATSTPNKLLLHNTFSTRTAWSKRRDIPVAILAWMAVLGIFFWLLSHISHSLLLLVIAAVLAYALSPAIAFFDRFMPRFFAIVVVYLVVLSGFGVLIYIVVTTAIFQLSLLIQTLSAYLTPHGLAENSSLLLTLKRFGISEAQITQAGSQLISQAEHLTSSIVPFLSSVLTIILDTLLIAVMSIYLVIDGKKSIDWLHNNVPAAQYSRVKFLSNTLQRIVGGYIRGQLILATIMGFLIGIGMALFHVPYAVLLGFLAFLLGFIPILGTFISGALCVLLALTQGGFIATLVLGYFVLMHVIEGDIIGPRVVGQTLGLHPLVSIVTLIAASELFGITGALFASPVAGLVQALLVTVWTEWKTSHPEAFIHEKKKNERIIKKNSAKKTLKK